MVSSCYTNVHEFTNQNLKGTNNETAEFNHRLFKLVIITLQFNHLHKNKSV